MDQGYLNSHNLGEEEQKYQALPNIRQIPVAMIENFENVDNFSYIEILASRLEDQDSLLYQNPQINLPCSICQIPPSRDFIFLGSCDHFFCNQCLFEYLKIRIEENQVQTMPCPYDQCHSQILDFEIQQTITSELYNKYIRFKNVEALNKQPFLKWCPKPDCEGYDVGSLQKSKLQCNVCKHIYCFYCGEAWHRWKKCKFSEDKEMDKWAKENGIKYCPNCKRKVEKLLGCEHLTCPICKYEWCWVCGDNYTLGHLCKIEGEEKKNNDETVRIMCLILAPIIILFFGVIKCTLYVYDVINHVGDVFEYSLTRFIMKHRKISYFLAIIFGLTLSPIILLSYIYMFCIKIKKKVLKISKDNFFLDLLISLIGYILLPIIICLAFICPLVGILFLIKKIYVAIRASNNPGHSIQGNQYGYN